MTNEAGEEVFGLIQRGGRRIRIYKRDENGVFVQVGQARAPMQPRYVSFFHSTRGAANHDAPDRMLVGRGNGASVYALNLP